MMPFPTSGDAAAAPEIAEEIRDVNTRYHDGAAADYDSKWGVDYSEVGQAQVTQKLQKVLGKPLPTFERSLEIGAGTGYFTLNLMQAGVIKAAAACDISPGMIKELDGNAERLGLEVETVVCDAEALPFADGSFDLVMGHAVLHHIPDLKQAFREFHRVLKPGGYIVFAGEPSEQGDKIAAIPKQAAMHAAPLWRKALRARPADYSQTDGGEENHQLEGLVDVHAFDPQKLSQPIKDAGFEEVKVVGEELAANWFGWFNRSLESTANQEDVPFLWRRYAFRGYLLFQKLDRLLLEGRLPAGIFYNLLVVAKKR